MLAGGLAAALAFLLGRAAQLASLAPLGTSFYAARPRWWVALGAALGALAGGGPPAFAETGLAIVICWLLPKLRLRSAPAAAGLAAALARLAVALQWPDAWSLALAGTAGLISALAATAFARAVPALDGAPPADSADPALLPALAVLAAATVAGLGGWSAGPLDLQALGATLALAVAARLGPAPGVTAGVAIGGVSVLVGGADPASMGGLALGGLLGGFFSSWWGRYGAAGGCLLGVALVEALYPAAGSFWGAAVGAALGCAVPAAWLPVPRAARPEREPVPERLRRLAAALEAVGQMVSEAATAAGDASPGPQDRLAASVCPGCRAYARCWERNFVRAYRMLGDLAALAETRPVAAADVGGPETVECLRRSEMARAANLLVATEARVRAVEARLAEERRLVAGEFRAVAGPLGAVYGEAVARRRRRAAAPTVDYAVGVACLPRPGRTVSGDAHLVREIEGRLCLALSDGMGSGPDAARQSVAATELLERLLGAGFSAEAAARMVNSVLLARSDTEAFATLDLALVDLADGSAEFWKVGAAPTLIVHGGSVHGGSVHGGSVHGGSVHGGSVERIESGPVPAGVLPDVEVRVARRILRPGDVVVLASDGVGDAARRGEPWLADFVARHAGDGADALASAVLAEAVARAGGGEHDDLTVVACRLAAAGSRGPWAK
jgi:stage II sporulation protein E